MRTARIERAAVTVLFAAIVLTALAMAAVPNTVAVTRTLFNGVCVDTTNVPTHYSFTQTAPYWAVVGVSPVSPDDKDIYVWSGPNQTGSVLAQSVATLEPDFVVGDFNHTSYGTFYPTVSYGSTTASYTVQWRERGNVWPLDHAVYVTYGGSGTGCAELNVWDVYLQAGAQYRISVYVDWGTAPRVYLFRNPGTGTYWAGRSQAVLQVAGGAGVTDADYTAPASDWYGFVVTSSDNTISPHMAMIEIRKLNSCQPLASGTCQSAVPFEPYSGPVTSYSFTQPTGYWSAVAVAPTTGERKTLHLRDVCNYHWNTTPVLAASEPGLDQTALVVGDFNHAATLPFNGYVTIDGDNPYAAYTIDWDDGTDIFPMNGFVSGSVGGTSGACNLVEMWDILLDGSTQYRINFTQGGSADMHAALFGHQNNLPYYAGLSQAIFNNTAPHQITGWMPAYTDYYGLAIFANKRETAGSYYYSFEELDDCDDIASATCLESQGNLKDFHIGALNNDYWIAVGVLPPDGDDKDISIYSSCDGGEPLLGFSNGTQGMDFVVADCNHPPVSALSDGPEAPAEPMANNWYPRVTYGLSGSEYTVASDLGNSISEDLFPHDVVVPGVVGGTSGSCGMLKIWDVYLQSGLTYTFGFTRSGNADVRVALFRNPTNTRIYKGRAAAEFQIVDSGNFDYTAPATDYYGLVVFANKRGKTGSYTLRVSRASGVTGIDPEPFVPDAYALYQNAPNPFNPTTEIRYDVPSSGGHVQLRVYDVHGRVVRTLVDAPETGGAKSVIWDARNDSGSLVATGVYFYRLDAPGFSETRKTVVMK